jgi:pilus assembly protein CpaF
MNRLPEDTDAGARARLERQGTAELLERLEGARHAAPSDRAVSGGGPTAERPPQRVRAADIRADLQARILDDLVARALLDADEDTVETAVREFVADVLASEDLPLNDSERRTLAEDLVEETLGVGPLAPLMSDPAVTDVLVNGPEQL